MELEIDKWSEARLSSARSAASLSTGPLLGEKLKLLSLGETLTVISISTWRLDASEEDGVSRVSVGVASLRQESTGPESVTDGALDASGDLTFEVSIGRGYNRREGRRGEILSCDGFFKGGPVLGEGGLGGG